jgi:hypothetical protein
VVLKEVYFVAYKKIVKMIPVEKRGTLSNKLLNFLLKTKNESKMSSSMANCFLSQWRADTFDDDVGLAVLLEATAMVELEKMTKFLEQELQLANLAKAVKDAAA